VEWYEKLDLAKIGDEERYRLFDYVTQVKGLKPSDLGISWSTYSRIRNRKVRVSDSVLLKILQHLTQREFEQVVSARDRLRALGILREDGSIDYGLALEILALASQDEYLKQAILRFVVQNFREDLRKMLGLALAHVEFRWTEDFEHFLRERKKRRKVLTEETLNYYRNLFREHLEGRTLSEELVEYVVSHPNRWLRNVFRHYIQYLYYKRRIPPETFGWLMEVVPSRSYRLDIRPYRIELEDVRKTMIYLKEHHEKYYALYRLMLESGARLSHAIRVLKTFNPSEVVELREIDVVTKRLVCFERHCRYFVGIRGGQKPCEWIWFSRETLELLERCRGVDIKRDQVSKYAARHNLLRPKYLRKVNWRILVQVVSDKDVARFIQSRFGELRISEARYGDLLTRADREYPKVVERIRELGLLP